MNQAWMCIFVSSRLAVSAHLLVLGHAILRHMPWSLAHIVLHLLKEVCRGALQLRKLDGMPQPINLLQAAVVCLQEHAPLVSMTRQKPPRYYIVDVTGLDLPNFMAFPNATSTSAALLVDRGKFIDSVEAQLGVLTGHVARYADSTQGLCSCVLSEQPATCSAIADAHMCFRHRKTISAFMSKPGL